ncbi:MAG: histidine phosphatase family protein [Ruminococcaceae bacterium]|nr:histidine phosphatase family protein [Oscillospiraceae bacterium]
MKVYFIRHGQSESNSKREHGGWGQYPLTEQGKKEAMVAGKRLEGMKFDKVYSSDLIRTIQTQEIAYPCDDVERSSLIREVNVGDLMGRTADDCYAEYGDPYIKNKSIYDFSAYGGENYEQFYDRIYKFIKELEKQPYENVAIFCHGGMILTMMDIVTGLIIPNKYVLRCPNCGVFTFVFTGKSWQLDTWNYRSDITLANTDKDAIL